MGHGWMVLSLSLEYYTCQGHWGWGIKDFLSVALKISHFVKATVVFGTGEIHYH